ncbi:substrate-binding domain-containing protein [Staphylococcus aureus]
MNYKQQLKAIYSGKAKTWKDVNSKWPDKKINAVSPNSSHGTYDFFENEVMNKEDIKAEKNADTNAIVSSVTKNKRESDTLDITSTFKIKIN